MHIDHSKLVELLVETSGLEKKKVESQLKELLDEIKAAIEEGDAYEVGGLGVFSGIGNNVIFIPADELSTEINYKYAGMEPIEMDDAISREEETPQESEPSPSETHLDEDPFAGLLDDVADADEPGPHTSFELDMDLDEETEDHADDDEPRDEEAPFDLDDEKGAETGPQEEKPGPDKWGIDTYKDDTAENMFSGLLGKQQESQEIEKESMEEDHFNAVFEQKGKEGSGDSLLSEFTETEDDSDDTEEALRAELEARPDAEDEDDEEEFNDPFETLAAENNDDEDDSFADEAKPTSSQEKVEEEEEVIPVIKNLSSEGAKKKRNQGAEKAKAFEPKKDKTKVKTPSEPKSQPVMRWVLLIILILGGGTYALGYLGIVNIPGVTPQPQMASTNTQTTPPATQAEETTPQEQQAQQPQEDTPVEEPAQVQEQEPASQVSTGGSVPANQSTYGMTGVPVSAANDGYTIVIYSLSRESSAESRRNELSEEGYRVLVASVPSQQYGTLWRVSLGQFRTMRDAALAAEELESPFSENYFITKIQ